MPWWAWIVLGAGGWLIVAVAVAFGAARLIAAADRATRPQIAPDASNEVGQAGHPGYGVSGRQRPNQGPIRATPGRPHTHRRRVHRPVLHTRPRRPAHARPPPEGAHLTMTTTLPTPCTLCSHDASIGQLCWRDHDHLADLLSDRPGTAWNPARPDDPYIPPGIRRLLARIDEHDGQRATRPQLGGRAPGGFRSTSPADDTVITLRDPRTQPDDGMPWLVGMRWLSWTAGQLAEHLEVATARRELRALQRALLGLIHDEHGPRWVGTCRVLVGITGAPVSGELIRYAWATKPDKLDYPDGLYLCSTPLWSRPTPPAGDDERPPLPSVRCPSCRTVYGGASLARMGRVDLAEEAAA